MANDPAGFRVDLTNCDREPIHILGTIQPFGFLLAVSADWMIGRVSDNIAAFTGKSADALLGSKLTDLITPAAQHDIRNRISMLRGSDSVERLFSQPLFDDGKLYDVAVHFSGNSIVIECEPALEDPGEAATLVRTLMSRLAQADTLTSFIRESARQVKAITGFDRVMVYRFDAEGSGEVVAEALSAGVDSFLGLHYPASDIPAQARQLYVRNPFRIIADVNAEPVPIVPQTDPSGAVLDQSLCLLRAVSPIHVEYLRNMGVSASLSISIIVEGKLWGLFACHHYQPRLPGLAMRTAAELFGQIFSLMLESRERSENAGYESRARGATDRLMASIAQDGNLLRDADWLGEVVFDTIPADGVGAYVDGSVSLSGLTPSREQFISLVSILNQLSHGEVFATDCISSVLPEAAAYADVAAGLIAIPLSRKPRDYVVFFRSEQMRSVRWGGNPEKPVELGPNGDRLTPRKSFESWSQLVKGRSLPFTTVERRVAEALRVGMLEVLIRLSESAGEERQRAQERQELLIAELNHRVRNILSLIRGLVSQTRDGAASVEDFTRNLDDRLQALARAHDQVTRDRWGPARLRDLIDIEANAFLRDKRTNVETKGANILLQPVAFTVLSLVFHELMTNAAKYGALSDSGTVLISWQQDEDGSLLIDWSELGGPAVTPPSRRGFGSTVIEKTVPHDLGGDAKIHYRLSGVKAHFCIPSRFVAGVAPEDRIDATDGASADLREPAKLPLAGQRVLLVEDSLIIALDGQDALMELGAEKVEVASSVTAALRACATVPLDVAMLDYNLGAETSEPVARALAERGIPFVFATGYGSGLDSSRFHAVPIVTKPYGTAQIAAALAELKTEPAD
ncbi:HWE histidine kinase domain-containing protein [Sphingobium sp. B12D2B]|uniref:HWE histidine kinase domain-containing protein n=1 Tax=Sphingobium sp. B12D2B TaxID=2940577 RepID=UPI002224E18F|nr:HWE histidine kinase domain-containing protein [Sphingobium sp. B12D2B]MCW2350184.1 light-regulated signal transduction histidine kinase (bacteriophytochrome) [Sphingobium sp. B12D2B]